MWGKTRNFLIAVCFAAVMALACLAQNGSGAPSQPGMVHPVGAVKAINGNTLTIATDAGTEANIEIQEATKILRLAPGEKDLKSATAVQLSDVQTGDRVLVTGTQAGDKVTALRVIVMKQSDIAQKQQQEREDWQRRGAGGLVTAVDPAAATVTISTGPNKKLTVQTTKATVIREYSPDSVKFDDAKSSTLAQISACDPKDQAKPCDQLRARGDKSADGSELQAQEIVFGAFRNIAGTVITTDAASQTISLKDLATKKPVTIKISSDSQLRQLPPMLAQRLAMRLKGGGQAGGGENGGPQGVTPAAQNTSTGERGNSAGGGGFGQGGQPRSGQPDLQQILSRMPAVSIGDLQKGQVVMLVATEGSENSAPTAITLLTGVEPILTASPNDSRAASMLLSPWSLGGGGAGDTGP